jgi:hypothetical protein
VLLELHTSPVGGNSGFLKAYHRAKREFVWDGLKNDVQRFVAECLVLQQNKVVKIKTSFTTISHSKSVPGGGFYGFHHRVTKA